MAMTSFPTLLQVVISSGPPLTIGEVRNIDGPSRTTTVADASHLRVPFAFKRKLPGLKDGGELTFTVNLDGANYANGDLGYRFLVGRYNARGIDRWLLTWPDGGREAFFAFISAMSPATPEDDVITCDITLAVSGSDGHVSSLNPLVSAPAGVPTPLGGVRGTDY